MKETAQNATAGTEYSALMLFWYPWLLHDRGWDPKGAEVDIWDIYTGQKWP